MEKLVKEVEQLLDHFAGQEIGNKLSDFAMIALKNLMIDKVRKYKVDNNLQKEKKT